MKILAIIIIVFALVIMAFLAIFSTIIAYAEKDMEDNGEYELPFPLKPWKITTDDWMTVKSALHSGRVLTLKLIWSWRHFKLMYHFTFLPALGGEGSTRY